jgi:hypothetical protein
MSDTIPPHDPYRSSIPSGDKNPFRDNPYTASDQTFREMGDSPVVVMPAGNRALVTHVPVVAVFMIVQGVLELIMGLALVGLGFGMPFLMKEELQRNPPNANGPTPEMMSWIFVGVYGVLGMLVLAGSALHVVAGIRNYGYRSRTLGIVALIAGMASTLVTCYCAPTAIAIGVYGLVCYLNPSVAQAFQMVAGGRSKSEVLTWFR